MSSAIQDAVNYQQWMFRIFSPYMGSHLLEIGTGFAQVFHHLQELKIVEYVSVDFDEELVEMAKAKDGANTYLCADVSGANFISTVGAERFDTVFCFNVLEHIKADNAAVQNMMEALKVGGRLLLFVPALPELYSDMDRLAGHHRRYTKQSLSSALGNWADSVVRIEYFNPIGGVGWWINKFQKVNSLNDDSVNRQIVLFDKYILPLSRLINPLTRNFFGQSLVCVVEK